MPPGVGWEVTRPSPAHFFAFYHRALEQAYSVSTNVRHPRPASGTSHRSRRAIHSAPRVQERVDLHRKTRQMLAREIAFIPSPTFREPDAEQRILSGGVPSAATDTSTSLAAAVPRGLPAHLARLCEAALLSAEHEQSLFQQMNFLKFRAHVLRTRLDPQRPSAVALEEIEWQLAAAQAIRDRIATANMRLVMALAKKFVTPQVSFDELLSEGIETLLHAVDKFDFGRGFRFSTYAYRAIARAAYRAVSDRRRDQGRFTSGMEDALQCVEQSSASGRAQERLWLSMGHALTQMLDQLDRRERLVIRARYALGRHRRVRTFQSLADRLGVSKERVRQLEQRAVRKLRKLAGAPQVKEMLQPLQGI